MGDHVDYAGHAERRAGINAHDAALRNGGRYDAAVDKAGHVELASVMGGAGHFGASVDSWGSGADVGAHVTHRIFLLDWTCGVPLAACVSVRTMARRASSILNVLWE
jgi:hypothetical protein